MPRKQGHPQDIIDPIALFCRAIPKLHNVDADTVIQEMRPKVKYGSRLIVTTEQNRLLSFLCDSLMSLVPFFQTVRDVV